MEGKQNTLTPISRVFLDSSTLQTLQDYGGFIYDGMQVDPSSTILHMPEGIENLEALRSIVRLTQRVGIEFSLSANSLSEVLDKKDISYLHWALEMLEYWEGCLALHYPPGVSFEGWGPELASSISQEKFGYLSVKDMELLRDAVTLECDAFLTMERKLPTNSDHIKRELRIFVAQPVTLWSII
jgi:hypothetical protein